MAKYRIEVVRSAEKTLFSIPKPFVSKIIKAIENLADNPYPAGCRKFVGQKDTFRIRVNVYRIIYEVHDDLILIKVLKIGHRKDVYRY